VGGFNKAFPYLVLAGIAGASYIAYKKGTSNTPTVAPLFTNYAPLQSLNVLTSKRVGLPYLPSTNTDASVIAVGNQYTNLT
jgi:hypothetical protein